jgi:predicted dehydrogenase
MADAAAASGARLIEAFHYRYHPLYASYLGLLAQGAIGKIRSFEATFDAAIADKGGAEIRHLPETGGGAFMDLGCYPLSWMLTTFADDPVSVSAHARLTARGVDEAMGAEFCFADGATARLSTSMATDRPFAAMLRVVGEAGEIVFDNPLAPHRGAQIRLTREGRQTVLAADRLTTYFHQLDAIIRALTTGEALPTGGAAILRQQHWLDAVYDAAGLARLRWRDTPAAP